MWQIRRGPLTKAPSPLQYLLTPLTWCHPLRAVSVISGRCASSQKLRRRSTFFQQYGICLLKDAVCFLIVFNNKAHTSIYSLGALLNNKSGKFCFYILEGNCLHSWWWGQTLIYAVFHSQHSSNYNLYMYTTSSSVYSLPFCHQTPYFSVIGVPDLTLSTEWLLRLFTKYHKIKLKTWNSTLLEQSSNETNILTSLTC